MAVLASPVLTLAADTEAGGTVRLTITPGRDGDVRILYKDIRATSWTDDGTFTGTDGVETTHDVTGLTDGEVYEFLAVSIQGFNVSWPSRSLRARPTDGSGSIEEQAIAAVVSALEGILTANGYDFDVNNVYRHERGGAETPPDSVGLYLFEEGDTARNDGAMGDAYLVRNRKPITIEGISTRKGRAFGGSGGTRESSKEAKRLYNAIGQAMGSDLLFVSAGDRKVLNLTYLSHSSHIGDEHATYVSVEVRFLLEYRHRSDNPSRKEP